MLNIVILTATVSPKPGVPSLKVTDPELRLQEYLVAFRFYIDRLGRDFDALLFAENSGADLTSFEEMVGERHRDAVEFIRIPSDETAAKYGRAHAEFMILEFVMDRSAVIRANSDALVWKISGRYVIENVGEMIKSVNPKSNFSCNCRNWPTRWADMFLIAWDQKGFEACVRGAARFFDEQTIALSPEVVWRDHLDKVGASINLDRRFKVVPVVRGVRGFDGSDYQGFRYRAKTAVRKVANKFFPYVWI